MVSLKNTVEICANCGKVSRTSKEGFRCPECGSDVSVVIPLAMFKQMIKSGAAKE